MPLYAAMGERAMVVTPDLRATQAALEVLKQGGNAVDAAVTAEWVLNVVLPHASGIGGGGLLLFYDIGTRRILSFDGSVKAPAKASPEMFLDISGKPHFPSKKSKVHGTRPGALLKKENISQGKLLPYQPERSTGGLPVGVPGILKLAEEVHAKYGTHKFPFAKLFEPAIRYAKEGTKISAALAKALRGNAKRLVLLDPEKAVFFENGAPLEEGRVFFQPELAKTLRLIQTRGTVPFYKGSIAKAITRAVGKSAYQPGRLNEKDLKGYGVAARDPLHSTYQGYDLFSAGAPSGGGVMLFRAFNILSHFGVSGLGQTPETYHLLAETQKAAFSNRAGVADPDLFDIPIQELLSEAWAQDRANGIRFDQVSKSQETPDQDAEQGKNPEGSSIIVADPQGNIVILFATLGDAFGSALRVAHYGFFLNNLLTGLAADPSSKDPQSPELISGGQRPRGPEAPVFAFKNGKPVLAAGAYGAEDPAAILLNALVQKIDLGTSCAGAVESPRVLVRGKELRMESGIYEQERIRLKLEFLGHRIKKEDPIGVAQMVCFDEGSGRIAGESDFRADGEAAGL